MTPIIVKVTKSGRLSLPAHFRKKLALQHGGWVAVFLEGNELRLRSAAQVMQDLKTGLAPFFAQGASIVEELIVERRSESAKE